MFSFNNHFLMSAALELLLLVGSFKPKFPSSDWWIYCATRHHLNNELVYIKCTLYLFVCLFLPVSH